MQFDLSLLRKVRALVVGDVMLDRYLHGLASRISPEAPVPIVHVKRIEERAGGAANVALNLSALGVKTTLLGLVGDDAEGRIVATMLHDHKITTLLQKTKEQPTISKMRIIGRNQQLLRFDFEEHFHQATAALKKLEQDFKKCLSKTDVVIFSDYAKGTLCNIGALLSLAKQKKIPTLVDPKSKDFGIYRGATIITPNRGEFETVVGTFSDNDELVKKARHLMQQHGIGSLVVTRSAEGMSVVPPKGAALHLPTHAREVYDATGAGDTVIATLGAAIAAGTDLNSAAALANLAASVVVRKLGTATVSPAELRRALQREQHDPSAGILSEHELLEEVSDARAAGETMVMTNGCFDILHPGHISYLEKAKALGNRLIVAVNTDASVQRLKGKNRPINPLTTRMAMLAALRSVDWVVSFNEDTPAELIAKVAPDILIKASDYKVNEIAGADFVLKNGGQVKIMPLEKGFSTTNFITKIRREP